MNNKTTAASFVNIGQHRLHYIDKGSGETILFVHGIPESSLMYEGMVQELSGNYRCIVPDHLGFGQSDKSVEAALTPEAHSQRLLDLINKLELRDIHLVVHDFGGPIGIGALVARPELFKSLTITNTWLWSLKGTPAEKGLKMMNGIIGRWLYLKMGFSVKFMAKNGFADKQVFKEHYDAFMKYYQTKEDRWANYQLMLSMLGSSDYYDETLKKLHKLHIPAQIIWGAKDKFFNPDYLNRWIKEFPTFNVKTLEQAGHFPHLEAKTEVAAAIKTFVDKQR
ncbi:MAG: alpha/beta fold hydrolase [Sphingobacteriales bacterium]|nr:MAG: alpha/beta fold hydrolase [Sphingobacteriales bacterium]